MGDKLIEEYIAFLEKKRLEELNMFSDVGSPYYDEETDTHVKVETADVGLSKPMYKTKYHVNEVLKWICCTGKNKPVVDLDKLKPGMTKDEIYHCWIINRGKAWFTSQRQATFMHTIWSLRQTT